jgi:hypothetical protein
MHGTSKIDRPDKKVTGTTRESASTTSRTNGLTAINSLDPMYNIAFRPLLRISLPKLLDQQFLDVQVRKKEESRDKTRYVNGVTLTSALDMIIFTAPTLHHTYPSFT